MLSAKLLAKVQIFIAYKFNKYYRVVKDFRQEFAFCRFLLTSTLP